MASLEDARALVGQIEQVRRGKDGACRTSSVAMNAHQRTGLPPFNFGHGLECMSCVKASPLRSSVVCVGQDQRGQSGVEFHSVCTNRLGGRVPLSSVCACAVAV